MRWQNTRIGPVLSLCALGSLGILILSFLEADHEQTRSVEKLRSIARRELGEVKTFDSVNKKDLIGSYI